MHNSLVRRLRWFAFRTPLAGVVKRAKRLGAGAVIARRRAMLCELPHDAAIEAAVRRFNQDGYVSLDGFADQAVLQDLAAGTEAATGGGDDEASAKFGAHKGQLWTHAIDGAMVDGQLDAGSAFARAALQPRILSVVGHALGLMPRLDYVTVTISKPMTNAPSHSQLWHRDYDDVRVIKFFVYLSDVDEVEDGPFTLLPAAVSDRIGFAFKSHRGDAELPAHVDLERDRVRLMGRKFSCFMVETSRCLHMGSRVAPGHGRLMFTATYFAPPRILPERDRPFFLLSGTEGPIERAVLLAEG